MNYEESLVEKYVAQKLKIKRMEEENKEILEELVMLSDKKEAVIGDYKLTQTHRKGSVSYAKMVADLIPNADKTPYTGAATSFWSIK